MRIRPMKIQDLSAVQQIDAASFPTPWPPRAFRSELLRNPVARLWVAEILGAAGSQVAGFIASWLIEDELHIGSLAVAPLRRRSGFGSRLLTRALQEAQEQGARTATLEVRETNHAARALYERLGFQVVGRRLAYYQDNREDALLMTLFDLDRRAIVRPALLRSGSSLAGSQYQP